MPDGDAEPEKYSFTVFTPTYNRAATLARVYESLQRQTLRDFEWLIVDDGSEDGTAELVERWRAASSFPIRYVWQRNQGEHVAFNRGVGLARGELFLTIDSDDECVPVALKRLMYHWNEIPSASRSCFAAVTGLCMDQNGRIIGDRFPRDVLDSNSIELVYRYKVRGDKWGFSRTDILRDLPFPADGKKLIPESVVWNEIATKCSTRYVNEVLLIAFQAIYESGRTHRAVPLGRPGPERPHGVPANPVPPDLVAAGSDSRAGRPLVRNFGKNAIRAGGFMLHNPATMRSERYRYRGGRISAPALGTHPKRPGGQ